MNEYTDNADPDSYRDVAVDSEAESFRRTGNERELA